MTEARRSFSVSGPPKVEVRLPAGDIRITQGGDGAVDVALGGSPRALEGVAIEQHGDTVLIHAERRLGWARGLDVDVTAPAGVAVVAKLTTADLAVDVTTDTVDVDVTSGDVRLLEATGSVRLKSASGDMSVGPVGGDARIAGASGDVRLGGVKGEVEVRTASGDVAVERIGGRGEITTAAGDIRVHAYLGPDLVCRTMAGDVVIGVPPGRTIEVELHSLSGDVRSDLPLDEGGGGAHARLHVKTLAGDIRLVPAAATG